MAKIIIEALPKGQLRYDTLGDWLTDQEGNLLIQVQGQDPLDDEAFLLALHELVEAKLCHKRGISQDEVDEFDLNYKGVIEPGDDPKSPYRAEHRQAMLIEHLMANFLGIGDYGVVE